MRSTRTSIASTCISLILAVVLGAAFAGSALANGAWVTKQEQRTVFSPHLRKELSTRGTQWMGSVLATWYGPGFYGHRTGCGTTLSEHSWGVAHRTLPCGTLVYLSYGGKRIAVPVIDRGPYSGATLDLTYPVAHYLGLDRNGSGDVVAGALDVKLSARQIGVH